jgi:hypothetical protein
MTLLLLQSAYRAREVRHRGVRGGGAAFERTVMSLSLLFLIVLVVLLVAALPTWPYSRSWGYYPGGILGIVLLVLLVMFLLGYL